MTSIFGVFSVSGPQDLSQDLDFMIQSLGDDLNDNLHTWNNDMIAMGQSTFHITPESFNEELPLHQSDSNLTIVGNIRLDNREELFAKLAIPTNRRFEMGDAELVLASYAHWEGRCVEHLLGDFSFAVWDGNNQQLFCCTDHFALHTLYYYYDQQKLIFSSHPQAISAVPGIKTGPNFNKLARFIDPSLLNILGEETWYENVFVLTGATILLANAHGVKTSRYWQPVLGEKLTFKNDAAYTEAFQELFFETVSCRMRSKSPVTALLSGGLDSSSIVSVAAKILEAKNQQLNVFSVVLPDQNDPLLKDERYYIDLYKAVPNIKINYVSPESKGFFSDLDICNYEFTGPSITSRHFLYSEFARRAEILGSRVLLDGVGGELGATDHGVGFHAELFWTLNWPRLWKELKARKALAGTPIWTMFRSYVIKPFAPDFLLELLKNKADINVGGMDFFQQSFKNDLKSRAENLKKNTHIKTKKVVPVQRSNQLYGMQMKQNRGHQGGITGSLEFRYPFMDKRVLEFCLNSPTELKVRNGYNRNLIRVGLNGILPPEIQWRTTKTAFSPDYMRRYKAQVPQVKEFLDSIKLGDPIRAVIDIEKLKDYARLSVTDNETDSFKIKIALHELPFAIYTIYYLRSFKEFQN